jgi:hypothetical protein
MVRFPWRLENQRRIKQDGQVRGRLPALTEMEWLAGEEGFEPSNAGIKIRCLNQLGDSPAVARIALIANEARIIPGIAPVPFAVNEARIIPGIFQEKKLQCRLR